MFKKTNTRKFMKALHLLFIFIRLKPDDPVLLEIIKVFLQHLNKNVRYHKLDGVVRSIQKLEESEYKNSIVHSFKKIDFKTRKFSKTRIEGSIPIIQDILGHLITKIENKEFDKASIMASAVHNLPDFLINDYRCNSEEFWEEHIKYYYKTIGEEFLEGWEYFFKKFYINN